MQSLLLTDLSGWKLLLTAVYHKIYSCGDFFIGAVHTATLGNHASARQTLNATGVEYVHAFADAIRPGYSVTQLGSSSRTSAVAGHAGGVINILT